MDPAASQEPECIIVETPRPEVGMNPGDVALRWADGTVARFHFSQGAEADAIWSAVSAPQPPSVPSIQHLPVLHAPPTPGAVHERRHLKAMP